MRPPFFFKHQTIFVSVQSNHCRWVTVPKVHIPKNDSLEYLIFLCLMCVNKKNVSKSEREREGKKM